MLVMVLHSFTDKNTNIRHLKGQKISISKKRVDEINNAGYGPIVKIIKEEKKDGRAKNKKSIQ